MRKVSILAVAIATLTATAQDVHMTQMYGVPLLLNPAMTGFFNGCYRVGAFGRLQWSTVMEAYKTLGVYADSRLLEGTLPRGDALGAGLFIVNDRSGDAPFIINMAIASGAYHKSLGDHTIAVGLQIGYVNKQIGNGVLYFPNQYVENVGFNPAIPTGESIKQSIGYPDFNIGVLAYGSINRDVSYFAGLAYFHLTQPKEQFSLTTTQPYRYPSRYVLHGGVSMIMTDYWRLIPTLVFMYQARVMDILPGVTVEYELSDENFLSGSLFYRYGDAIAASVGLGLGPLSFGIASDFNIGPLSNISVASRGWGGIEFIVRYTIQCYRLSVLIQTVPCPRI